MHGRNNEYISQQDCSPYHVAKSRPKRELPIPPFQRNVREGGLPLQFHDAQVHQLSTRREKCYLPEIPSKYSSLPRNFHNYGRCDDRESETSSLTSRSGRRLPDYNTIRNLNYRIRTHSNILSFDKDLQESYEYPSYAECTSESIFDLEKGSSKSSDLETNETKSSIQEIPTIQKTESFKKLPKEDNKDTFFFLKFQVNNDRKKIIELCCLESVISKTPPESKEITEDVQETEDERTDTIILTLFPQTGYLTPEYDLSVLRRKTNEKRSKFNKGKIFGNILNHSKAVTEVETTKNKKIKGFFRNIPKKLISKLNMSNNNEVYRVEHSSPELSLDDEREAIKTILWRTFGIDNNLGKEASKPDNGVPITDAPDNRARKNGASDNSASNNDAPDDGGYSKTYSLKREDRLKKLEKMKLEPLQMNNVRPRRCQATNIQQNKELPKEDTKILQLCMEPNFNQPIPKEVILRKELVPARQLNADCREAIRAGDFDAHKIRIATNDLIKLLKPISVSKKSNSELQKGNSDQMQNSDEHRSRQSIHISQAISTLAVSLAPFAAGLAKGYSSPAIASFQSQRVNNSGSSELRFSDQEASWIASISFVGALFGGLFGGVAMRYGRKRLLLAISLPFSMAWILTFMARSVFSMCCSSLIGGFCCSIATMVSQVYISEVADSRVRGFLSAILKIVAQSGLLTSYIVGAYVNWRQLALLISIPPAVMFLIIFYLPETPSYLMLIGKEDEAYQSLKWFKGSEHGVLSELDTIRNNIIASKNLKARGSKIDLRIFFRLIRPIWITCSLMFFQRFSGAQAFSFYAVPIFKKTFVGMNPHGAAISVGFVQLLASCLSGLLVDSVGRVPLLMGSSIFMSISSAAFGSYIYYEEAHKSNRLMKIIYAQAGESDWVPLICVLVFMIAFSMGVSPIPWLLIGEIFPLEHRGFGSAFATSFSYLCAFVSVKTFVDFQEGFGLHGAFWIYAFFSIVGLGFVARFVPETRASNLEEMDPTSNRISS